ncbi:major facilitator superfamily domain-containing protein [Fennellomyces sp. T-0311]|nr:major facilitator superfamily domain-containing protein [Fennellomyces sp. T-0311]
MEEAKTEASLPKSTIDEGHFYEDQANAEIETAILSEHPPVADKEILRRIKLKRDMRIMPLVSLFYLFSCLDRVNIGNAKVAGITDDISITGDQFNVALSIFFIGYILFEFPANMILERLGPKTWISVLLLAWGTTAACLAAVKDGTQLIIVRLFLGFAEAGLAPAVYLYLSVWYTRAELAKRIAIYFAGGVAANTVGGILAFGIMNMDGYGGLHGWQWIFIIEAIPSIALSFVTFLFLPEFPEKATFWNDQERTTFFTYMKPGEGEGTIEKKDVWKPARDAIADWKLYCFSIIGIGTCATGYTVGFFLPSIVHGLGFSAQASQGLSAAPNVVAIIFCLGVAISADNHQERALHITFSAAIGVFGFVLLMVLENQVALYIATIFICCAGPGSTPVLISWFASSFSGRAKCAAAVAIINSFSNLGGVIAGQLYRDSDAPRYTHGHGASLGLLIPVIMISLVMKVSLLSINRKRDTLSPEGRDALIASGCSGDQMSISLAVLIHIILTYITL